MTHRYQGDRPRHAVTGRSTDPFDDYTDLRDRGPVAPGRPPLPVIYRRRRWAAVGVLVIVAITLMVLVRALTGADAGSDDAAPAADNGSATTASSEGPLPGEPTTSSVGDLPAGATVTEQGKGTWQGVGSTGAVAGDPDVAGTRTVSYVVEVEQGLDTSSFGGGDAFAAMVDATLADPRSWISGVDDGGIAFRHVSVSDDVTPDLRVRLTSPVTTRQLCGGEIETETSCFLSSGDTSGSAGDGWVLINAARWVRGALTFAGDIGSYRQYVLNHEIGHGIGYASHQPCPSDGGLAPIMMQQTLSLTNRDLVDLDAGAEYAADDADTLAATCRANPWPHPQGGTGR
ncbi:DUF3152 domain-containing protein [Corynebacterium terpenotabidum]|uniref:DUF3152 domain-containing protein n=1 Tax=Corynebacterium terpenotabidum TaxID=89154 RepID=UPI001FE0D43F|nr:DUF3152 domain-containing protein [Corynebacterium terpenotabidum]